MDRLSCHPVHAEYRRRLLKLEDEGSDYHRQLTEGGISETEGVTLLAEEEPSLDIRRSCLEWCSMQNIEYIEACASNADFDKCKALLCPFNIACEELIISFMSVQLEL